MLQIIKSNRFHAKKMFQNSYFNSAQLQCLHHRSNITHICTDYKCTQYPFFCPECLNSYSYNLKHVSHQSQIKPFHEALDNMSAELQRTKKPAQKIYKNLLANKDSESLLKWQQQKEQHFVSIHNHINSIKHVVEEQIENICRKFRQTLVEEKTILDQQLDNYESLYREKLQQFARFTQPIATMSNTYKYCANKNNIILKLVSESSDNQMISYFNNMKRVIRLSQKVQKDQIGFNNEVSKLAKLANQLMDDLPRIRDTEYQRQTSKIYSKACSQILRIFVKVRQSPNINRSYSMQAFNDSTWKKPK